jgi:hypothetical protein
MHQAIAERNLCLVLDGNVLNRFVLEKLPQSQAWRFANSNHPRENTPAGCVHEILSSGITSKNAEPNSQSLIGAKIRIE